MPVGATIHRNLQTFSIHSRLPGYSVSLNQSARLVLISNPTRYGLPHVETATTSARLLALLLDTSWSTTHPLSREHRRPMASSNTSTVQGSAFSFTFCSSRLNDGFNRHIEKVAVLLSISPYRDSTTL